VTGSELTDRIIAQGRALVRAIEALGTIEPAGSIERALARLLLAGYKRRLRGIVGVVPAWVTEEILSASERPGCGSNYPRSGGNIEKGHFTVPLRGLSCLCCEWLWAKANSHQSSGDDAHRDSN